MNLVPETVTSPPRHWRAHGTVMWWEEALWLPLPAVLQANTINCQARGYSEFQRTASNIYERFFLMYNLSLRNQNGQSQRRQLKGPMRDIISTLDIAVRQLPARPQLPSGQRALNLRRTNKDIMRPLSFWQCYVMIIILQARGCNCWYFLCFVLFSSKIRFRLPFYQAML